MSAECDKCGSDLVYRGEYPDMFCQVCELRDENARLREEVGHLRPERDILREEHGKGRCVPADEFERAKEPIFAEGMRAGCEDLMREAARMDDENARLREALTLIATSPIIPEWVKNIVRTARKETT